MLHVNLTLQYIIGLFLCCFLGGEGGGRWARTTCPVHANLRRADALKVQIVQSTKVFAKQGLHKAPSKRKFKEGIFRFGQ